MTVNMDRNKKKKNTNRNVNSDASQLGKMKQTIL